MMLQSISATHANVTEIFLVAMLLIFMLPFLVWRCFKTDYFAPLVVVQIVMGIVLGPGMLGAAFPVYYHTIFNPQVVASLNGIAWWAVMIFVMIAGIELDVSQLWAQKKESAITASLALGMPLFFGVIAAFGMLAMSSKWIGANAETWQFVVGIGMSCAVTALPILILFMEKLNLLRTPLGQRILRYASLDDVAIWAVLAIILLQWDRLFRQGIFLGSFVVVSILFRKLMQKLSMSDRWYAAFIWLLLCAYAADWSGLHFMVGAFLAGIVMDGAWFNQAEVDKLRGFVLMMIMPVFFLSTGLKTMWQVGGGTVFIAAALLLIASVFGKLAGIHIAAKILKWQQGEASIIGWLLQTKALIMIIFANVLLDKNIIINDTFTALLLMAIASTMLTTPMVAPKLAKLALQRKGHQQQNQQQNQQQQ